MDFNEQGIGCSKFFFGDVATSVGGDPCVNPQLDPVRIANLIFVMSRGARHLFFFYKIVAE